MSSPIDVKRDSPISLSDLSNINLTTIFKAFLGQESNISWQEFLATVELFLSTYRCEQSPSILKIIQDLKNNKTLDDVANTPAYCLPNSSISIAFSRVKEHLTVYWLERRLEEEENKRPYEWIQDGRVAASQTYTLDPAFPLQNFFHSLASSRSLAIPRAALAALPHLADRDIWVQQPKSDSQCRLKLFFTLIRSLFPTSPTSSEYKKWKWHFKLFLINNDKQKTSLTSCEFIEALKISTTKLLSQNILKPQDVPEDLLSPPDSNQQVIVSSELTQVPSLTLSKEVADLEFLAPIQPLRAATSATPNFLYVTFPLKLEKPDDIQTNLNLIHSILLQSDPNYIINLIELFTGRASLDKDIWSATDKDVCAKQLKQLGLYYTFYQIRNPVRDHRGLNTLMTLCWLSLMVAELISPQLCNYGVDISYYENLLKTHPLNEWSKREIARRQQLLTAFKDRNNGKDSVLFKFDYPSDGSSEGLSAFKFSYLQNELTCFKTILNEEIDSQKLREILGTNDLDIPKYNHLGCIWSLFYMGQALCGRPIQSSNSSWSAPSKSPFKIQAFKPPLFSASSLQFSSIPNSKAVFPFEAMFGKGNLPMLSKIGSHPFYRRGNGFSRISEEYYLINQTKNPESLHPSCSTTQLNLALQSVILWCLNHMGELKEQETQAFVEFMFSAVVEGTSDNISHFLLDEELQNPAFVTQITHFITTGIKTFYHQLNSVRPDVFTTLFFIRLSLRLQALKSTPEICGCTSECKQILDLLLKNSSLTPEENQAVYLHRAYANTIIQDRSDHQLISDWTLANLLPSHRDWNEPLLIKEIQKYIYELNLTHIPQEGLNNIVKMLTNQEGLVWSGSFPVYEAELWKINCYTGQVWKDGEDVSYKGAKEKLQILGKAISNFNDLFPEEDSHSIYIQGKDVYFFSARMRCVIRLHDRLLQKMVVTDKTESVMCTYVPNSQLSPELPEHIKTEPFFCWSFPSGEFKFEMPDGSKSYQWSRQTGLVDNQDNKRILTLKEGKDVRESIGINTTNIIIKISADEVPTLTAVEFPSITHPHSQKSLFFTHKEGHLHLFSAETPWILKSAAASQSNGFQRLLFTDGKKEKALIIVPYQFNRFCYLEYDVTEQGYKPSINLEGSLVLALDTFKRADYNHCLKLLSDIPLKRSLPPLATHILLTLITSNTTPNPAASCCILKAAAFLAPSYQQKTIHDEYKREADRQFKQLQDVLKSAADSYCDQPNRAGPLQFRLTPFHWEQLAKAFEIFPAKNKNSSPYNKAEYYLTSGHARLSGLSNDNIRSKASALSINTSFIDTAEPFKKLISQSFYSLYQQALSVSSDEQKRKEFSYNLHLHEVSSSAESNSCLLYDILHLVANGTIQFLPPLPQQNDKRGKELFFENLLRSVLTYAKPPAALTNTSHLPPKSKLLVEKTLSSSTTESVSLEKRELIDTSQTFQSLFKPSEKPVVIPPCPIDSVETSEYFKTATQTKLARWKESYEAGAKFEREKKRYTCPNTGSLKEALKTHSASLKEQVALLKRDVLTIANHLSPIEIDRVRQLLLGSNVLPSLTLEECIRLFVKDDFDTLIGERNPTLNQESKQQLKAQINIFLKQAIQLKKLERADEALQEGNIQLCGERLFADSVTNANETINRYLRALEYFLGFQIRQDQADIIQDVIEKKIGIYQLMMGGGKTSVIITLLMMILSDIALLPVLTAPQAQIPTLAENLSSVMHLFGRDLYPIKIEEHLNEKELELIYQTLLNAQKSQGSLLISNRDLQLIELEFIRVCDQINSSSDTSSIQKRWLLLKNILLLIDARGILTADETHLALTPKVQTIIPIDQEKPLPAECINILKHICLALEKQHIAFDSPDLFSPQEFRTKSISGIAKTLYEKLFQNQGLSKEEFVAYIESSIRPASTLSADITQKLSFIRSVLQNLITHVLAQSYNRNFGRGKNDASGKVIPYSGVDSPAPTQFADPIIEALYCFLMFIISDTTLDNVKVVKNKFLKVAISELISQEASLGIDETPTGVLFKDLTGILLSSNDPKDLDSAVTFINQSKENKIAFAEQIVLLTVKQHKEILKSTSVDLTRMFSQGKAGVSGTTSSCFAPPMTDYIKPDSQGVDGRIAIKLMNDNPEVIYCEDFDLKKMAERLERCCCLIDVGGFLRNSSNETVAREILRLNPKLDRIFFYGRENPQDSFPDCLMMLDRDALHPAIVRSTRKEELEQYLKVNYFVLFDERHCEATDFPLPPKGQGLLTVSADTNWDKFIQGLLRERGFLEEQTVLLVTKNKNSKTVQDVIQQTLAYEFPKDAEARLSTAVNVIQSAARDAALKKLLSLTDIKDVPVHFKRDIFVTTQTSAWENATLTVPKPLPAEKHLIALAEIWKEKNPHAADDIANALKTVLSHLDSFPSHVQASSSGGDEEMEMATNRQTEALSETETELQTQRQLSRMLPSERNAFQETDWPKTFGAAHNFPIIGTKNNPLGTNIFPLNKLFDGSPAANSEKYASLFPNLLTTLNFAKTDNDTWVSVFSSLQKEVQFILFVHKESSLNAVCLSLKEADYFKKLLRNNSYPNMWLKLSDGSDVLKNDHPLPDNLTTSYEGLLFEANLFQGNIRYLLKSCCAKFLLEVDQTAALQYLSLKVADSDLSLIQQLKQKIRSSSTSQPNSFQQVKLANEPDIFFPNPQREVSIEEASSPVVSNKPDEPTYKLIGKGICGWTFRIVSGCLGMALWAPNWYNYFYEMSQKLYLAFSKKS